MVVKVLEVENSVLNHGQKIKLEAASEFIARVNKEAYKDIFLLSNQVLSKNPFTSSFLSHYLRGEIVPGASFLHLLSRLVKYYAFSFKDFASYVTEFILFKASRVHFKLSPGELVLIDTFFQVHKADREGCWRDTYFPGLSQVLDKLKKHYVYLFVFDGSRKSYRFTKILNILKDSKVPFICEYQLLSFFDLMRILFFILIYPFRVMRLIGRLGEGSYAAELLKFELVDTLGQVTFRGFSRYLQGKNISRLSRSKLKVISWFENQVIHKNFYKGLRTQGLNKVRIYGAQLFLYSSDYLNITPDPGDAIHGLLPDKILVNGPGLLPDENILNYATGPSLRYAKLFNQREVKRNKREVLLLLSNFQARNIDLFKMASSLDFCGVELRVKPHPSMNINEVAEFMNLKAKVSNDDMYKLFETAGVVIGASSGSLVEAASLGIPVITVKDKSGFDFNNPFPDFGKGLLWEQASSPEELKSLIIRFQESLENNSFEIENIAGEYRRLFFCEPTENNIIKSFELQGEC